MSAQQGKQYAWVGSLDNHVEVAKAVARINDINVNAGWSAKVESNLAYDGDYYVVISTNGVSSVFDTVGEWVQYMKDDLEIEYSSEIADLDSLELV